MNDYLLQKVAAQLDPLIDHLVSHRILVYPKDFHEFEFFGLNTKIENIRDPKTADLDIRVESIDKILYQRPLLYLK